MKKPLFLSIATASLVLATTISTQAQIAKWTFETSAPITAGPFTPEIGSGSALGSHTGAAVYSSPAGNGSAHSFSANTWAVGDYYQFQTGTIGFNDIALSFDQTSSSTGPGDFYVAYSTDGSTFTKFGSDYTVLQNGLTPNASWNTTTASSAYSYFIDLSSISALDNAPSVYFRLVDDSTTTPGGGTVAATGTDRVDNFTITIVPEPQSLSLCLLGGLGILSCRFARRKK